MARIALGAYARLPTVSDEEEEEEEGANEDEEEDGLHSTAQRRSRRETSARSGSCGGCLSCPSAVRRLIALLVLLILALVAAAVVCAPLALLAVQPSDVALSTPPLTAAQREVVELLTGRAEVVRLSPPLTAWLAAAVHRLAEVVLLLRPGLQRDMWMGDCLVHNPCPFPDAESRRQALPPIPDESFHARMTSRLPSLSRWLQSWHSTASADSLFHSQPIPLPNGSAAAVHSSPSTSLAYYAPGEHAEAQALSQRFQQELFALQHPANCSEATFLVMDYWHTGGGFGSWNHARSIPLALAMRAGRTLIEAPSHNENWAYVIAWNDCVRKRGMGGCGLFLPATHCAIADDWRVPYEQERSAFVAAHAEQPSGGLDERLQWLAPRRWVAYTELRAGMGDELHHNGASKGWERGTLAQLPQRLAHFRHMPECWWMRQAMAYHQRMTRPAQSRLAGLLTRSLQLPQPLTTARLALDFADRRAPSVNQTAYWWLLVQSIKVTWQLHMIAPGLARTLREELLQDPAGSASTIAEPESPWAAVTNATLSADVQARVPLLGFTFVRHGDKASEAALIPDSEHLRVATLLANRYGVRAWYVGADSLTSADNIRAANANSSRPLHLLTSILTDSTPDKATQPTAAGFDRGASFGLSDAMREEIAWSTILHHSMAQMADVFAASWASNHVRFAYEQSTTLSEERAATPIYVMDGAPYLVERCR